MKQPTKTHILGICGTFMGGIAAIAKQLGHQVSGCDQNIYPPMSQQLQQLGITIHQGYDATPLPYDHIIVGNVMTRGMPIVEQLLQTKANYQSGPQWLGQHVLRHKTVYAVAGTHGKTTTAAMLAWIMQDQGLNPGFLIGGVSPHFKQSARLTDQQAFVIEADEYDSAFFDKRSKFIHYHPNTLILNNLEFDHADIFPNLQAIKTQFHHLLKILPQNGNLIINHDDANLAEVVKMGLWSKQISFGSTPNADYHYQTDPTNPQQFSIHNQQGKLAQINWQLQGKHNQLNALAAILAANQAGISITQAAASLNRFHNVKRRMELIGQINNIKIYDDFAHHPTAIETTIKGAKTANPNGRIIIALEPRSNSMRAGVHAQALPQALSHADLALMINHPEMHWNQQILKQLQQTGVHLHPNTDQLIDQLTAIAQPNDHIIFMSNGSFNQAFHKLHQKLKTKP